MTHININIAMMNAQKDSSIVVLDVRRADERATCYIPGSLHLPLDELDAIEELVPDLGTTVYVYCESGYRSAQAAGMLQGMGYANAVNIGGINNSRGRTEKL